jgi:hypothetical protein
MDCEKYLYFEGVLKDATYVAPWKFRLRFEASGLPPLTKYQSETWHMSAIDKIHVTIKWTLGDIAIIGP